MSPSKFAYRVLRSLSIRVLAVVVCAALLSYWNMRNSIEKTATLNLTATNRDHAERESVIFEQARKNHELLKTELLRSLARAKDPDTAARRIARFDSQLVKYADGTIRNNRAQFNGATQAGVFIPPGHKITPEFKVFIATLMELTDTFGKAFRANFQDTYFNTPENVVVSYWPEQPLWPIEMAASFDMTKEEYGFVADAKQNPARKTVWTGLFYDKVGGSWMTSGLTPVYEGSRHVATAGHDVLLSELTNRIKVMNKQEGARSIIFRRDGRLIAHPEKEKELQASEGKYYVTNDADPYLRELYNQVISSTSPTRHPSSGDLIASSTIIGPDWILVTIYPNRLIAAQAIRGMGFIFGLAILCLIVQTFLLYRVLEKEVNVPLQELSAAAEELAKGQESKFAFSRDDELGRFANAFRDMQRAITERDRALQNHAVELEGKVRARTLELEEQKVISIQRAKMASLGEMAGGVAHEINNPLAVVTLINHQALELLEEKILNKPLLIEILQTSRRTHDRIAKIVRGLRTFSRSAHRDPMQLASLQTIIQDTLSLCGEKFKYHGVEIRLFAETDISVLCRATEISQVILNLLNNSFDAVTDAEEKWIELRLERASPTTARISVTDSGTGIPAAILERVMEPFFTTKEVGKGTGLGLSISKGIADSHEGKFFVDTSKPHTCFVLELTVDPKNQAPALPTA